MGSDVKTRQQRFTVWVNQYEAILGPFSPETLPTVLAATEEEVLQSGIDTEKRQFIYAAARLLMPHMNATQYIRVMDVVFSPGTDIDKLHAMLRMRDEDIASPTSGLAKQSPLLPP